MNSLFRWDYAQYFSGRETNVMARPQEIEAGHINGWDIGDRESPIHQHASFFLRLDLGL